MKFSGQVQICSSNFGVGVWPWAKTACF